MSKFHFSAKLRLWVEPLFFTKINPTQLQKEKEIEKKEEELQECKEESHKIDSET